MRISGLIAITTLLYILLAGNVRANPLLQDSTSRNESWGGNINSVYDEQNPVLSPDGKIMYFTRKNHPGNAGGRKDGGDIWFSELGEDGVWNVAKRLNGVVNNKEYNAIIGFSNDGKLMYLQNHYSKDGNAPKTQGISVSKLVNGRWTFPEKLTIAYYYNRSKEPSMRISEDGRTMVLSIESYDTKGAEDIYVSFRNKDNTWSQPVNLGSTINTGFQEMTPYLAKDNITLFFASNGHGGFGSRDIFISRRLDNSWKKWTKPTNLGKSVNTKGVELSYHLPGGDYAYYVSTQNSEGFGDIQRHKLTEEIEKPDNLVDLELLDTVDALQIVADEPETPEINIEKTDRYIEIQGKVVNANDLKQPVKALLSYRQVDGQGGIATTYSNDSSGAYQIDLKEGFVYHLTVAAEGYMNTEERLVVTQTSAPSLQKYYLLTPLEIGTTVNLKNVLFERGTSNLLEDSYTELNSVVKMMEDNPNVNIELQGHTDNQGSGKLNLQLSQKRVDVVKAYLVEKGIESLRISGKGFGGTRPIASNASEETRKLNRRVEFTIVKN